MRDELEGEEERERGEVRSKDVSGGVGEGAGEGAGDVPAERALLLCLFLASFCVFCTFSLLLGSEQHKHL